MTTTINYPTDGEGLDIVLPDGRTVHLWHHHCPECTSLDVQTYTADRRAHHISARTGNPQVAPVGVFTMTGGMGREIVDGGETQPEVPFGRKAQGSIILTWKDSQS